MLDRGVPPCRRARCARAPLAVATQCALPRPCYLCRIMKDDAECVPMTGAQAAHSMPNIDPVGTACAPPRPMVHGEDHGFALDEGHDLRPRLHPRALLREHKLAPGEILARAREEQRDLEGKDEIAVEVLVQAIVIPGAVLQQKWRRPVLPGLVAAREITCVIAGIGCGDVNALIPAIGDLSERWIKFRAQDRYRFRERISEIFVLAPPKTMSGHDAPTAKGSLRCVARGKPFAFARCQQRSGRDAAMRVECLRNLRPVERGDAGGGR